MKPLLQFDAPKLEARPTPKPHYCAQTVEPVTITAVLVNYALIHFNSHYIIR